MRGRREIQMIAPIRELMSRELGLTVITEEFSAGYGVADLVGARISEESCRSRNAAGFSTPLDHRHFAEVLIALKPGIKIPISDLAEQVSFSETTLKRKILPRMASYGLVARDFDGSVCLLTELPQPTELIVAIEAKQTRWREAIFQARRYTFFANQTYIAVWDEVANIVDKVTLNRHRLGLIGVGLDYARVVIEAPKREPHKPIMNRYCAEFLYRQSLDLLGTT